MKKYNKASFYSVLILFLIFVALLFVSQRNLKTNGILLTATTTHWGVVVKGYDLNYNFFYNGEKKTGNNSIDKIRGLKDFEGKYFPVIYDPKYGISQILIDPAEFKKYNVPFPDSLNWVLPYFK
ncbi:MAG: hypothetical protein J0H76_00930 [Sphingobacteriales bacterium]|nr:hypothetical protein [Sphingobacteriales bacterium]